jgi:hypothetical protein
MYTLENVKQTLDLQTLAREKGETEKVIAPDTTTHRRDLESNIHTQTHIYVRLLTPK